MENKQPYSETYYQNNKDQIAKQKKTYQQNNKDQIAKQKKIYYQNNKDQIAKQKKTYQQNNKDQIAKQKKTYQQNNKDQIAKKDKIYRQQNKKKIAKRMKTYQQNNKEKLKDYRRKPETKLIRNLKTKQRIKTDENFCITLRLRCNVKQAFKYYINNNKIYSSKKYGVDYKAIISQLLPFPEDLSLYHIDHIKPLCSFNFINEDGSTNLIEVQKAFAPDNHQWLLAEDNLSKGGRFEDPLIIGVN